MPAARILIRLHTWLRALGILKSLTLMILCVKFDANMQYLVGKPDSASDIEVLAAATKPSSNAAQGSSCDSPLRLHDDDRRYEGSLISHD